MSGPIITAPAAADIDRLARQFLRASELCLLHLGRELLGDDTDLDALQALLDLGVPARDARDDLQCLGVVFGTQLVDTVDGLDWVMVEHGGARTLALRYRDTDLLLFPLREIAHRVADGLAIDVVDLYEEVCDELDDLRDQLA